MELPDGWRTSSVEELRAQVEAAMGSAHGDVQAAYAEVIRQIDAGEVRGGAAGPSGFAPWTSTLIVEVADDASVDALIERVLAVQVAFAAPTSTERTTLSTALGDAVRLELTADVPPGSVGVPARALDYFLRLDDGRLLWVNATGPAASTPLEDRIDGIVATLARR